MKRVGRKVAQIADLHVFYCPGCQANHGLDATWTFDGNGDMPTFSPSVLVTTGHYPDPPDICHSFVRGGNIEFLNDSTHHLRGQTVSLPDFEYYAR